MTARAQVRSAWIALLAMAAVMGCGGGAADDASVARGRGLEPARLPVEGEAALLDAAARATFDASPDLVLRLHPLRLPRTAGDVGGDSVPSALLAALRARGTVVGGCTPQRDAPRNTPRCQGTDVGYIVRATEPLRAAGDTVQLYLAAEGYGPAQGTRPQALRLEKVYQLVGAGTQWRVVREARAPGVK